MNKSENIDELAAALAEFQAKMPMVPKLHTGKIEGKSRATGKEYSYEYSYADMGDAVEASRPHLAACDLAVVQAVEHDESGHLLTTLVLHKSGQWIEGSMCLLVPEGATWQVQGSAITYARRYSYCASLGIVADTDDDGTLAQMAYGEGSGRRRTPPRRPASTPRRPIATDPATDGKTECDPKLKNRIISHLAHLEPPVRTPQQQLAHCSGLVEGFTSMVKMTQEQGEALAAALGVEA